MTYDARTDSGGGGIQGLFGTGVDQSGANANAGGFDTSATGDNSFAIGNGSDASGENAYAGGGSTSNGADSFSHGNTCIADADRAFATGNHTQATGVDASSQNYYTQATGDAAHAENHQTVASGNAAHSEGYNTIASGDSSHSQNESREASGIGASASGTDTIAAGDYSEAAGWASMTFRTTERATAMQRVAGTLQKSELCITSNQGSNDINIGTGTGPIIIPVHDGHFDAKLTVYSDDLADRWDITFRGDNDATNFAGRDTGTVTIAASGGTGAPSYGSSTVTWTVTGTSTGDVQITPSVSFSNRWAHVELFELHANI